MALCKKLSVLLVAMLCVLVACGAEPVPEVESPTSVDRGPPISFSYPTIDGKTFSSAETRGRYTVIAFSATYEPKGDEQALYVSRVFTRHVPRINAGIIMLESAEHGILIETWRNTFEPPYPVAIADPLTIAGKGPFRELNIIPSVIILDPQGREAWRHIGRAPNAEIEAALRALEKGQTPP